MIEEYNSIMKNDVQEIVLRLVGKLVINSMWFFKIKHAVNGSIKKYITRFVGKDTKRIFRCREASCITFRCPIYIHVLDEKRTKLEPSSIKGIFVGYSKTSKAY
jgi:hypothetical protein